MEAVTIGWIGLGLLLVFIFCGLPTAVAFFVLGFVGNWIIVGWNAAVGAATLLPFTILASFTWSVIPLFVMMGITLFECGIGEEVFSSLRQWIGHFAGGMAASVSAACALLGTMTASTYATAALMARTAYPELRKFGYQKELALAVGAASATVARMIPPSITLVIYAVLAEQSVAMCLMGGVVPGFLSMAIYMAMIFTRCKINPSLGPPTSKASWGERFKGLRYLLPAGTMMVIIIGGIYFGIFTGTEAAGCGAFAAFLFVLALRRLTWAKFKIIMTDSIRMGVMVMIVLMAARFYARFLNISLVTVVIAKLALGIPSPWITLGAIFAVMFFFGMFIGGPLQYVTVPLFAPVVEVLGFDLVWFGICVIKMVEVGSITPPVCMSVFIAQSIIQEVPMEDAYRAVWWFVLCDVLTLGLFVAFPQIVLWLPTTMRGA